MFYSTKKKLKRGEEECGGAAPGDEEMKKTKG